MKTDLFIKLCIFTRIVIFGQPSLDSLDQYNVINHSRERLVTKAQLEQPKSSPKLSKLKKNPLVPGYLADDQQPGCSGMQNKIQRINSQEFQAELDTIEKLPSIENINEVEQPKSRASSVTSQKVPGCADLLCFGFYELAKSTRRSRTKRADASNRLLSIPQSRILVVFDLQNTLVEISKLGPALHEKEVVSVRPKTIPFLNWLKSNGVKLGLYSAVNLLETGNALKKLDPRSEFFRSDFIKTSGSCKMLKFKGQRQKWTKNFCLKDLTLFDWNIDNILLIDNSFISILKHLSQSIVIKPFLNIMDKKASTDFRLYEYKSSFSSNDDVKFKSRPFDDYGKAYDLLKKLLKDDNLTVPQALSTYYKNYYHIGQILLDSSEQTD